MGSPRRSNYPQNCREAPCSFSLGTWGLCQPPAQPGALSPCATTTSRLRDAGGDGVCMFEPRAQGTCGGTGAGRPHPALTIHKEPRLLLPATSIISRAPGKQNFVQAGAEKTVNKWVLTQRVQLVQGAQPGTFQSLPRGMSP